MDYTSVSSSSVAAVGYDESQATLGVRFNNGSEYHYFGVPSEVYDGLLNAPSVGTYLNQYVKKGGYSYSRVQ